MLPEGWKKISLADAVRQKISYGIVQAGPHVNGGVPYIKSSDVRDDISLASLQRTSTDIHRKYIRSSVHPGDIVFSLRGNIGATCIVPPEISEANLTQGTARISCSQKVYPSFLIQELRTSSCIQQALNLSKGSTFKEISLESLRTLKIILPPLPEQKKIAAILSTWDRAIEGTEKLLANSQQQKKALMQQLLTGKKRLPGFTGEWKKKTLSNVCQIKTGKKDVNEGCENGEYPFFTCAKQHTFSENYSYDCEAILIAGNGEVGKTHYYNGKFEAYQRTYILSDFTNISVFFLLHFIEFFLPLDISKEKQHGAMPYIKLGTLKDFSVVTPPIPEQRAIAAILTTADEEIASLESDLSRLRQEKKALMQQLLTGKRRVTVD